MYYVLIQAYQTWVADKGIEEILPGLQFTPEQLFYISFSQV